MTFISWSSDLTFCLEQVEKFYIVECHTGIMSQCDAMIEWIRIVGHSDLYFMV